MDGYTLTVALLIIITLAATVALVLIYTVDHKYGGVLFNLTIIGYTHSVFFILYLLKAGMRTTETNTNKISSDVDLFVFSTICFSTSVAIVLGDVTLECKFAKACYGIFFFIALCLIVGIHKMLGKCICIDENRDDLDVKRVDKVVYCFDSIDHVIVSIFLEYALIYVPAAVLFYTTIRQASTFHDWLKKPYIEKCTGCRFNMALFYYIAIAFLIVIWCLRPICFLSVKFTVIFFDFRFDHGDFFPVLALQATFFIVLTCVIKVHGCGERHSKTKCLNNNEPNTVSLEWKR